MQGGTVGVTVVTTRDGYGKSARTPQAWSLPCFLHVVCALSSPSIKSPDTSLLLKVNWHLYAALRWTTIPSRTYPYQPHDTVLRVQYG